MNPSRSSGLPADLGVPPGGRVIPVEEWDWDEIHRLEDAARKKFEKNCLRCEICGRLMVCGQQRTHYSCRPPAPPEPSRRKLSKK